MEIVEENPFRAMQLARSHAINEYASYERSFCQLFAEVGNIEEPIAALIYYKKNNARSRHSILESILKRKVRAKYTPFWKSLIGLATPIDQERNEIIHWVQYADLGVLPRDAARKHPVGSVLKPPNFWWHDENTPIKSIDRVLAFADKCSFISSAASNFSSVLGWKKTGEKLSPKFDALIDICEQVLIYPPPADHPLGLNHTVWRSPPQSSQA